MSRSILVAPFWYLTVGENRLLRGLSFVCIALVFAGSVFFTYFAVGESLELVEAFRWQALLAAVSTWRDSFWLGAGPGSVPMIQDAHESGPWASAGDAMNTYLNLLSTLGLVGLISYAMGWIHIIRCGVNSVRADHRRLWIAFAAYNALMCAFISVEDFRHLYLFSGWLLCLTASRPLSVRTDLAPGRLMG